MTTEPNEDPAEERPDDRSFRPYARRANQSEPERTPARNESSNDEAGNDDYFNREQFNKSQFGAASYERPRAELGRQPRTFRSRGDRSERPQAGSDHRPNRGDDVQRQDRYGDPRDAGRQRDERRPMYRDDRAPRRDDIPRRDRPTGGESSRSEFTDNSAGPRGRSFHRDVQDARPFDPRTMGRIDTGSRFGRTSDQRSGGNRRADGRGNAPRGDRGTQSKFASPKRRRFFPDGPARAKKVKNRRPKQEKRLPESTLVKLLVSLQWASRRRSILAIREGRVAVNGLPQVQPNVRIKPDKDVLTVDHNVLVRKNVKPITIVYHKPVGVSGSREEGRPSVYSAVAHRSGWYMPVGSLTKTASGIIILSNDPAHKSAATSILAGLTKDVCIKVHRNPKKTEITKILKALKASWAADAKDVAVVHETKGSRAGWLKITHRSGSVRDMMLALKSVGLEPLRTIRSRVGPFSIDDVHAGAWYRLTDNDVLALDELAKHHPERDDTSLASIWEQLSAKIFASS